jgi:predicted dehydrogenase
MALSKMRFAVIGCGRMGKRRMHTLMKQPNTDLVCVADTNSELAKGVAGEFGCGWHRTIEDVLRAEDVECVIVSVPNHLHLEVANAALESKKHVFCEKPLGRFPLEAQAMVEKAARNGVTLKTGSNLRYFPTILKAKELLDQNAIGDLLFLRGWIGHGGENLGEKWYAQPEATGGGTLLVNGCHLLDIVRWFMGEPSSCVGMTQTNMWPVAPMEDNGFGLFEIVGGKTAFVHSSWTEWAGYSYIEIYGKEGYMRIDNRGKNSRLIVGDRKSEERVFDYSSEPASSFQKELSAYADAIASSGQPEASGYDGLRAVEMAHGVYEAARKGSKVDLRSASPIGRQESH